MKWLAAGKKLKSVCVCWGWGGVPGGQNQNSVKIDIRPIDLCRQLAKMGLPRMNHACLVYNTFISIWAHNIHWKLATLSKRQKPLQTANFFCNNFNMVWLDVIFMMLLGDRHHGLCGWWGDQWHYWPTACGRQSNFLRFVSRFFLSQFSHFSQVEKYDFANNAWVFEADLPWKLTGF